MIPSILPVRKSNAQRAAIAMLLAGACAASAFALPTTGGREDTGLRITDTSTGRTLVSPNGATIVSDTLARTNITVDSVEGGVDITVRYTNTGSTPLPLGQINIGGIRLGEVITRKEIVHDCRDSVLNSHGLAGAYGAPSYPDEDYSPVCALSDENYNFGASICYPVEDYDHKVDMFLTSRGPTAWGGGAHWQLSFRIWSELPAGQTRTYKVTVRFAEKTAHWLETLKPYREYFHSLYGDVRYTRDARPVRTFAVAYAEYLSASNQRGFYNPNLNPETNGYGPWANYIRSHCLSLGYERTMIWAVSGLYYNHRQDNFPSLIMSGADQIPIMRSTQSSFSIIPAAGIDLGFWFGYSSSVAPNGWDSGVLRIDPDNPAHMALAYAELDRAAALGTKTIGMDAFGWEVSPGKALRYLKLLSQRYPQIRFVTEVSAGDIYHVYAPTFQFGNQIQTPNYLADFLLPGNETWVLTGYVGGSDEAQLSEMRHYAALGYVPLTAGMIPPPADLAAAETWLELPEGIRAPQAHSTARGADGTLAAGLGDLLTRTSRSANRGTSGGDGITTSLNSDSGSNPPALTSGPAAGAAVTGVAISRPPNRQRVKFSPVGPGGEALPVANGPVLATGTEEALAKLPVAKETPTLSSLTSAAPRSINAVNTVTGAARSTASKAGDAAPPSVGMVKRKVPFVAAGTPKGLFPFDAGSARKAILPELNKATAARNRARQLEEVERQNAAAPEEKPEEK